MVTYEIAITRIEPNPHYKPEPLRQNAYDYHRQDERSEEERTADVRRYLTATLTEAEYEVVKQSLLTFWTAVNPLTK